MAQPQPQATASEGPCRTAFKRGARMVWMEVNLPNDHQRADIEKNVCCHLCLRWPPKIWNT